jgi:uncharacterized protein (TIGR00251 family)
MIREHSAGCTLAVRAQPGAKKTAITGIYGEGDQAALKVAVNTPPVDGRANEALIAFLAETFHQSKSSIQLLSGKSSRSKLFAIKGLSAAEAETTLSKALSPEDHFAGTE